MSDRAALYAAVCADPDDDTVRLVLADWLDENGDPRRAAFIRARVAYHATPDDTPAAAFHAFFVDDNENDLERVDWAACDPEMAALVAIGRATRKQRVNLTAKGEGAPRLKGVSFHGDRRGFLSAVTVDDGETFARHAAAVFRAAPVTDVRILEVTPDGAAAVVGSGYFDRVGRLDIQSVVDVGSIRVLGAHPHAAGVRTLEFDGGDDPEEVLNELAEAKHFTGLRSLDVMDLDQDYQRNRTIDREFAALLRRPKFHGLESLSAWGNGLSDETARALADGKYTRLRHVNLSLNWVTATGAEELARSKNLGALRHLDLSSNEIHHGRGAGALIASPALKSLTVLRLEGNQFSGLGPKALPANPRGPTLRALQLDRCNLWTSGAERLFACPSVRGLWLLDLSSCDLDDKAARALAKSPLDSLVSLSLNGNAITEKGLKALADSDVAARLQCLNVAGTKAGDAGARALCAGTKLTKLKRLYASGRGLARLKKHFGKVVAEGR